MVLSCHGCASTDIDTLEALASGRRRVECRDCGAVWVEGEIEPSADTVEAAFARFPRASDVSAEMAERARDLKAAFLASDKGVPDPEVARWWRRYQGVFGADRLADCDPQELKDFANSNIGANPGNMSVFNEAWNADPESGAVRTRRSIEHLLRGKTPDRVEDRLSDLIEGVGGHGMTGFKEALLTKVLCVMEPTRFLTILKYTGVAGKREIARSVYGLELPAPDSVRMRIGRLVVWSNDLLVDLIGDGFTTRQHAADFLWWAKDQ